MTLLEWSPSLLGAAFLLLFLARLPELIQRVGWDSDAATAPVIGQTFGHGTVILERFGWFTALWFELLTKPLPLHRQVWEVAPYMFALASVALLAWASARLADGWAVAMMATAAVATSPFVSYDLVTLNYHTTTWAATVVLAVFCLWVARRPAVGRFTFGLVLATVLAGTTLASDWLFAFVGLIPYAVAGLLLVKLSRERFAGAAILASAWLAVLIAWATTAGMRAHVRVFPVPTRFAGAKDLGPNVGHLLKGIVQLVNGDYFFGAQLGVRSALSLACAGLILIALPAPFILLYRQLRAQATSLPMVVYAGFWATTVLLNCASFVLSSEGSHGGYYLIPVLYAAAATVPLVVADAPAGRRLVGAGAAVIAVTSLVNLASRQTEFVHALPPVAPVANQVVHDAKLAHAYYGYADYWDASSLTWSKHMTVDVVPATQCEITQSKTDLCGFYFNVNTKWYRPRPRNTFVLRDQQSDGLRQKLPNSYGPPTATYQLSDAITMYVYPYDVARRFVWSPSP